VFQYRRYEPTRVIALMQTLGWERMAEAPFAWMGLPEYMLLLFRRVGEGPA
jgi:hypothetical protein